MQQQTYRAARVAPFVVATTLLLVYWLLAMPATSSASNMLLQPLQTAVRAGETMRFTGFGFEKEEHLSTWATDPTGAVLSGNYAEADGTGTANITFHVPADALSGTWMLTVRGDTTRDVVWASFEVYGKSPDSVPPVAQVAPTYGVAGTTFTFVGYNLDSHERVSYWVTRPDATIATAFHQGERSNRHGYVTITWTAPADAMPGRWVLTLQGYDSHEARAIPFHITSQQYQMPTPAPAMPTPSFIPPNTQPTEPIHHKPLIQTNGN